MNATRLTGQITDDRRLLIDIPHDIAPGVVEVILLQPKQGKGLKSRARRKTAHPAFGLWAKRTDITDSADFAARLRQRLEQGADRDG
ncbi:MAG: hypothetical protein HYR71_05810 [Chloroflexi bacterium]|nr:hypothetical protein [Chloroflexota bacterium]